MLHVDLKFVTILGNRLPLFKRRNDYLWNFRCPICGDSQKSKTKARAYIFKEGDKLFFKCHNCNASHTFQNFLEIVDPSLYLEYKMDMFRESSSYQPITQTKMVVKKKKVDPVLESLTPISKLPDEHPVNQFCSMRRIPKGIELYYVDGFKNIPDVEAEHDATPRLVLPIRAKTGELVGLVGRAIVPTTKRYINEKLDKTADLIYNLDKVDSKRTVFVLEGPIDSLFLPNAVAVIGTGFGKVGDSELGENCIYIVDNQPRNREVVSVYQRLIAAGKKVFIWPTNIDSKDINDLVLDGYPVDKLPTLIKTNSHSGLTAKAVLSKWKKI